MQRMICLLMLLVITVAAHGQLAADEPPAGANGAPALSALEQTLRREGYAAVAQAAGQAGDAARGAIAFHQPHIGCVKCHAVDGSPSPLGPALAVRARDAALNPPSDEQLVEAILEPSKTIRKGFESVVLELHDGRTVTGLIASETPTELTLRDPAQLGRTQVLPIKAIESRTLSKQSLMPSGLVNQMTSRQQLLDLVRYLIEIRDGGVDRATSLQPPPSAYAAEIPEYEARIDHAGIL
ncbi:MAG: hypothetical protein ACKOU6_17015, partial [Planctomycetota bacterium]